MSVLISLGAGFAIILAVISCFQAKYWFEQKILSCNFRRVSGSPEAEELDGSDGERMVTFKESEKREKEKDKDRERKRRHRGTENGRAQVRQRTNNHNIANTNTDESTGEKRPGEDIIEISLN